MSASLLNLLLTLTFPSLRKVIFKLNLVLKLWLVYTNFFENTPLLVPILCSKNYPLIFLKGSTPIYSIILPTNTPRLINKSILSTPQFLRFIPTIQPTFLRYFHFFNATPKPHKDGHPTIQKAAGRERPATGKKARRP